MLSFFFGGLWRRRKFVWRRGRNIIGSLRRSDLSLRNYALVSPFLRTTLKRRCQNGVNRVKISISHLALGSKESGGASNSYHSVPYLLIFHVVFENLKFSCFVLISLLLPCPVSLPFGLVFGRCKTRAMENGLSERSYVETMCLLGLLGYSTSRISLYSNIFSQQNFDYVKGKRQFMECALTSRPCCHMSLVRCALENKI